MVDQHHSGTVSTNAANWILATIVVAAMAPGIIAVRGLEWPSDPDGFRDIAIAQAIQDGRGLADPHYAGERAWYSPLVPGVVALISTMTGAAIPVTFVQLGPWLNALAPIAFFVFVRRLVGLTPAVFATVAFLFLPGRPPVWASATYTPWLFPSVTAQALLYATLATWTAWPEHTTPDRSPIWRVSLTGLIVGATFWAHSGAAAFAAGVMFLTRPKAAFPVALVSAAVVSPFLVPLFLEYRLTVLNRAPGTWPYEPATLIAVLLPSFRVSDILHLAAAFAGIVWIRRHASAQAMRILVAWAVSAGLLFVSALVAERVQWWPTLVPAFHFFFLLRALKWVAAGCGVAAAAPWLADVVVRRTSPGDEPGSQRTRVGRYVPLIAPCLALFLAAALYPRYLGREAHARARADSVRVAESELPATSTWIRQNTDADAVVLASDDDGLRIVGPAGRRVVSLGTPFANIYVSPRTREAGRNQMFAALAEGNASAFFEAAGPFGVTHVLAREDLAAAIAARRITWLEPVFQADPVTLFAVGSSEPLDVIP